MAIPSTALNSLDSGHGSNKAIHNVEHDELFAAFQVGLYCLIFTHCADRG
jgi:hypothetical protein